LALSNSGGEARSSRVTCGRTKVITNIPGAPIKNNPPEKKFYIFGIVADFFTRLMMFTEEDFQQMAFKYLV